MCHGANHSFTAVKVTFAGHSDQTGQNLGGSWEMPAFSAGKWPELLRPLQWQAPRPSVKKKISDFVLQGCSFGSFPESSIHLQL